MGCNMRLKVSPVYQHTNQAGDASALLLANNLPFLKHFRQVKVTQMLFIAPIFRIKERTSGEKGFRELQHGY